MFSNSFPVTVVRSPVNLGISSYFGVWADTVGSVRRFLCLSHRKELYIFFWCWWCRDFAVLVIWTSERTSMKLMLSILHACVTCLAGITVLYCTFLATNICSKVSNSGALLSSFVINYWFPRSAQHIIAKIYNF